MTEVVVAYVPVLHEGYRRFLDAHGRGRAMYVMGRSLYSDYRPLAKDIRALDPALAAAALGAWGICSSVDVLEEVDAAALAATGPSLVLPDEDVSHQVVERFFSRCEVRYATTFLRWDKTRSVRMLEPRAVRTVDVEDVMWDIAGAAESAAATSTDWWRQVGAAIRFADGHVEAAANEHHPHPRAPYAAGDPRANFFKGVHLGLSTATHAEARLIADAARAGRATEGAVMYVTDFPCPPCAKLIAGAGIARLYFREGYAVLDGEDVLEAAGVEIVRVAEASGPGPSS
jgi:dCMP deaminase